MLFDVDGDGDKEVVDSIETPYDANRDLKYDIEVVAYDSNGNDLVALGKANVTYYDSEGREVKGALTDAGTYTSRVTSHDYKLTGTTEMTITISPVYVGGVKSAPSSRSSSTTRRTTATTCLGPRTAPPSPTSASSTTPASRRMTPTSRPTARAGTPSRWTSTR